jgi:hypothetical protein
MGRNEMMTELEEMNESRDVRKQIDNYLMT